MGKTEKPVDLPFYLGIYTALLDDAAFLLNLRPSSVRADKDRLTSRLLSEGEVFMTKTLPSLGKALNRCLAKDTPFQPVPSFARRAGTYLPKFLGDMFRLILDDSGMVRNTAFASDERIAQERAVRAVRQICFLTYKLERPYTKETEEQAVKNFIETDASLHSVGDEVSLSWTTERAIESARQLLWYALEYLNLEDIVPGHGPGAVATGEQPHEKMVFKRLYATLEEEYPVTEYFFYNMTHLCDDLESLEALEELPHGIAKVQLVPKDSRGPRTISMEPLELQWIQQGQLRALVKYIEQAPLTKGFVNFTNQEVNRELARLSSESQEFVTLDMKDASDRVSEWLVRQLFPEHIRRKLDASRSKETLLPTGIRLKLRKYAPMGSSVCFPIEALTFWALAVGACSRVARRRDVETLPPVYVYGDDIICRNDDYEKFAPVFEELRLVFNEDKCCTGRFFRESCGLDAFRLKDVSPVYLRTPWEQQSPKRLLSYVSYINGFGERQFEQTRDYLLRALESTTGRLLRVRNPTRYACGIAEPYCTDQGIIDMNSSIPQRFNKALQRYEYRVCSAEARSFLRDEPGWLALLKGASSPPPLREERRLAVAERCQAGRYTQLRRVKRRWEWVSRDVTL